MFYVSVSFFQNGRAKYKKKSSFLFSYFRWAADTRIQTEECEGIFFVGFKKNVMCGRVCRV